MQEAYWNYYFDFLKSLERFIAISDGYEDCIPAVKDHLEDE